MRLTVGRRHFFHHETKAGKSCVRIEWLCQGTVYKSYVSFSSPGGIQYANDFWDVHYGRKPYPASVDEFLNRQEELGSTESIQVYKEGRNWGVSSAYRARVRTAANENFEDHINQFAKAMNVA